MTENNLYFIQLLQKAFKSSDRKLAFKAAIEEIKSKGKLPEYREGYDNFLAFINAIEEYLLSQPELIEDLKAGIIETKMIDLLTDTFSGSDKEKREIITLIKADPEMRLAYNELKVEIAELLPTDMPLLIEIEKDGNPFASFAQVASSESILIKGVTPGNYVIKLSTGLLIWQGDLSDKQLIWKKAFPKEKLKAAAETKIIGQKSSFAEPLLERELLLEVFPGLESGAIQLTIRKTNG
jgi:hypothetical protein